MRPFAGVLCLTLAAGCGPDPASLEQAIVAGAIVDSFKDRDVETTATHLDDWSGDRMIDPVLVANGDIEVRYCAQHFPPGSQALVNLAYAVNTLNEIPGLAFDLALVPEPGSETHPDPATFVIADHTIFVDYGEMDPQAWASGTAQRCEDTPRPRPCSRGRIYLSEHNYQSDDDPWDPAQAPSIGVFMHELAHVFGQKHMDDGNATDEESRLYDRTTIHGPKRHLRDPRGTTIQAATLAFLRAYYGDESPGLDTEELTVHPVLSQADLSTGAVVEFTPAKTFVRNDDALIERLNEVKLRWDSSKGYFLACSTGMRPVWLGRYSDTSTSRVDHAYAISFWVSTTETPGFFDFRQVVAKTGLHTYEAGRSDFRQLEWKRTLTLTAELTNVPAGVGPAAMTRRKLMFSVDPENAVPERRETNNSWTVTLCLYPEGDLACAADCVQ